MVCTEDTKDGKEIVNISTSSPSYRFWNESSMQRFKDDFSRRSICMERKWIYHDLRNLPIFPIFESRKWSGVLTNLYSPACQDLVQEFYANLPSDISSDEFDHKYQVYVRGQWINFNSNIITEILDLGNSDPSDAVLPDPSVHLDVVASELYGRKSKLTTLLQTKKIKINSDLLFDRSSLTGLYKMLNNIVATNIDSTGHKSKFGVDRAYLLYTIGTRQPINLSVFIFNHICSASKVKLYRNMLPFGRLITGILARNNVFPDSSDRVILPNKPLQCNDFPCALDRIRASSRPPPRMPVTAKATSSAVPLITSQSLHHAPCTSFQYKPLPDTDKAASSYKPHVTFPYKPIPHSVKATSSSFPSKTSQPFQAPYISKPSSAFMPPMTLQSLHASLSSQISELHAHMSDELRNIRQDIEDLRATLDPDSFIGESEDDYDYEDSHYE